MKAKIKKTGEIVNVSCMMADYGRSQQDMFDIYIEATFLNARTFTKDELEFISTEDEHWQDVRERAVIAALQGAVSRSHCIEHCVKFAVDCADALIEKLKRNNYGKDKK